MQLTPSVPGYDASRVFEPGFNIDKGTAHLASSIRSINEKGINSYNAVILDTFSYNRGIGTTNDAIDYFNSGSSIVSAMVQSCFDNYLAYSGCGGFDKQACCGLTGEFCDSSGCTSHSGEGLGSRYPEKVLEKYRSACELAGGKIVA